MWVPPPPLPPSRVQVLKTKSLSFFCEKAHKIPLRPAGARLLFFINKYKVYRRPEKAHVQKTGFDKKHCFLDKKTFFFLKNILCRVQQGAPSHRTAASAGTSEGWWWVFWGLETFSSRFCHILVPRASSTYERKIRHTRSPKRIDPRIPEAPSNFL